MLRNFAWGKVKKTIVSNTVIRLKVADSSIEVADIVSAFNESLVEQYPHYQKLFNVLHVNTKQSSYCKVEFNWVMKSVDELTLQTAQKNFLSIVNLITNGSLTPHKQKRKLQAELPEEMKQNLFFFSAGPSFNSTNISPRVAPPPNFYAQVTTSTVPVVFPYTGNTISNSQIEIERNEIQTLLNQPNEIKAAPVVPFKKKGPVIDLTEDDKSSNLLKDKNLLSQPVGRDINQQPTVSLKTNLFSSSNTRPVAPIVRSSTTEKMTPEEFADKCLNVDGLQEKETPPRP